MVTNAAQAAKLRQLEPQILEFLSQQGWQFSRIKVRPQTKFENTKVIAPLPRGSIPISGYDSLKHLAQSLPPGPIREAAEGFAKSRGKV
jgi:hypothetical protein